MRVKYRIKEDRVKHFSKVSLGCAALCYVVLCCDTCTVAYPGFFKFIFMQELFLL